MMHLNIETDNYGKFIQQVRKRARDPKRYSHYRPVLPDQPSDTLNAECFDIQLQADKVLVVRIRRFDLYAIGFRTEKENWFEFKRDDGKHLIQNSLYLPFTENYGDLGGLGLLYRTGLGYEKLKDAINTLAAGENVQNQKSSIMTIAVMLCESTRFLALSDPFAVAMHDKSAVAPFKDWMDPLIHAWSDLSERLLIADHNPEKKKKKTEDDEECLKLPKEIILMKNDNEQIKSALDAVECIAILKSTPISKVLQLAAPAAAAKTRRSNIQGRGQPLVEVFSIRINSQTSSLYGTILVADGLGSMHLYNRARNDPESFRPNETASLTGPARALSLCKMFTISLDLKDNKHNVVSKGDFSKDVFQACTSDKDCEERLSTTVGSATVYYTMFRTAVQATVGIILVRTKDRDGKESKDPASVYGSIVARYNHCVYATADQQKYYQTWLFNRPSNKPISVHPGNPIPLSRAVVAVPTSGASSCNLVVEAGLSDDHVAKGALFFSAQINGSSVQDIMGKYGSIRVTVAWSQVSQ